MRQSQKPPRLIVTWVVLLPVLLVITFVLSPPVIISVLAAAAISPIVHSSVGAFYKKKLPARSTTASRLWGEH
jgi:hypothetical protein